MSPPQTLEIPGTERMKRVTLQQRKLDSKVRERQSEIARLKDLVDDRQITGSDALFVGMLYNQANYKNGITLSFLSQRQVKWLWSITLDNPPSPAENQMIATLK